MTRDALIAALDEARAAAGSGDASPDDVAALLLRVLGAAATTEEVGAALRDVPEGRALLRFTDAPLAIAFTAGVGRLQAERAEPRPPPPRADGPRLKRPKVDAASATWLGLLGGTLKPWLAFTRGLVVCRAGLSELRWLQQVAERLQRAYADARAAKGA